MVARDSITIQIVDIPLVAYIQGGDRTVFQGSPLEVAARVWDPNTAMPYNADNQINTKWECVNLNTLLKCVTIDGFPFDLIDNTFSVFVD